MKGSMQEKRTRQESSVGPGSDQGLMNLYTCSVPSSWGTLGTKVKALEFLQSREEIVTGCKPMRITEKGKSEKVRIFIGIQCMY